MVFSPITFIFLTLLFITGIVTKFPSDSDANKQFLVGPASNQYQLRSAPKDNFTSGNERVQKQYDVIIIGAGWSGLSAAKTLRKNGVDNFKILDAHDYVGGRSKTRRMYGDVFAEEGSVQVNGIKDNVIYDQVVKEYGVANADYGYRLAMYRNGKKYGKISKFWKYYTGVFDAPDKYDLNRKATFDTVLDRYKKEMKIQNKPEELAILDAAVEQVVRYEMAAPRTSRISAFAGNGGRALVGGSVVPKRGFSSLVDAYAKSLLSKIELEAIVTKVNYRKKLVEVTYRNKSGESIKVKGKKVLSTIPVGVLKAGTVEFDPPLNKRKEKAINHLDQGNLQKVTLHWKGMSKNKIFWDKNVEYIVDVNSKEQGYFTYWANFYFVNGHTSLVGYLLGSYAESASKLTDDEIVSQATERLRSMYPKKKVPDPTHFVVSHWRDDPHTRGIYSYAKKGAHKKIRSHMYKPLKNRLYFAGEATMEKYWGTTHGAFQSGILAAKNMLKGL